MDNKSLLLIYHSRSGEVSTAADLIKKSALATEKNITVRIKSSLEAKFIDIKSSDVLVLGTSANFGYMSGALKFFFDEIYDDCLNKMNGQRFACFVKGNSDTTGAIKSIQTITNALGWKEVLPPLSIIGKIDTPKKKQCEEYGSTIAAGLSLGIF
tara:strand:- start:157 stop:621 length:465 start_codon:yes stop_codon:yes gene_type:complete